MFLNGNCFFPGNLLRSLPNLWAAASNAVHRAKDRWLGRVVTMTVCETVGGMAVGAVAESALQRFGSRVMMPYTPEALFLSILTQDRRVIGVTMLFAATHFSPILDMDPEFVHGYIGQRIGATIGGYLGLLYAGSKNLIWRDRLTPTNGYSWNMCKYFSAELGFNLIFPKSTIPYIGAVRNMIFGIQRSIVQSLAFSSQDVVPIALDLAMNKRPETTIRRVMEVVTKRYYLDQSSRITLDMIDFLEKRVLPSAVQGLVSPVLPHVIKPALKCVSNVIPDLTVKVFRRFHEYVKMVHEYGEETVRNQVMSSVLANTLNNQIQDSFIIELADQIVGVVQNAEKEIFLEFHSVEKDKLILLRDRIATHLKVFAVYALTHLNDRDSTELVDIEKMELFRRLIDGLICGYAALYSSHPVVECVRRVSHLAMESGHSILRRWDLLVVQREQAALVNEGTIVVDERGVHASATQTDDEKDAEFIPVDDDLANVSRWRGVVKGRASKTGDLFTKKQ